MGRSGTKSLWSSGLNFVAPCRRTRHPIRRVCRTWVLRESAVFDCVGTVEVQTFEERFHLNTVFDCRSQSYRVKPHEQLVLVSLTHYCASTPSLSTSWSRTTLQGAQGPGKTHLETSFPLRCFQRLSLPHIATRRCHWRDNRYTRGASTPVLSY